MANISKDGNGTQFIINISRNEWLNGSSVVFGKIETFHILVVFAYNPLLQPLGKVCDEEGMAVLRSVEECGGENGTVSVKEVRVTACGLLEEATT